MIQLDRGYYEELLRSVSQVKRLQQEVEREKQIGQKEHQEYADLCSFSRERREKAEAQARQAQEELRVAKASTVSTASLRLAGTRAAQAEAGAAKAEAALQQERTLRQAAEEGSQARQACLDERLAAYGSLTNELQQTKAWNEELERKLSDLQAALEMATRPAPEAMTPATQPAPQGQEGEGEGDLGAQAAQCQDNFDDLSEFGLLGQVDLPGLPEPIDYSCFPGGFEELLGADMDFSLPPELQMELQTAAGDSYEELVPAQQMDVDVDVEAEGVGARGSPERQMDDVQQPLQAQGVDLVESRPRIPGLTLLDENEAAGSGTGGSGSGVSDAPSPVAQDEADGRNQGPTPAPQSSADRWKLKSRSYVPPSPTQMSVSADEPGDTDSPRSQSPSSTWADDEMVEAVRAMRVSEPDPVPVPDRAADHADSEFTGLSSPPSSPGFVPPSPVYGAESPRFGPPPGGSKSPSPAWSLSSQQSISWSNSGSVSPAGLAEVEEETTDPRQETDVDSEEEGGFEDVDLGAEQAPTEALKLDLEEGEGEPEEEGDQAELPGTNGKQREMSPLTGKRKRGNGGDASGDSSDEEEEEDDTDWSVFDVYNSGINKDGTSLSNPQPQQAASTAPAPAPAPASGSRSAPPPSQRARITDTKLQSRSSHGRDGDYVHHTAFLKDKWEYATEFRDNSDDLLVPGPRTKYGCRDLKCKIQKVGHDCVNGLADLLQKQAEEEAKVKQRAEPSEVIEL
ncbi:hypothetical protein A1O3_09895 [Capronia epimyces CBS 606.96]|uniref:Uncharacterized protein n=1 Tax=Capronia epimyces CBS 606.96 TaxID=1182542 RepID=W9XL11_9EURO|nr:uncharacterized protein A1O3_09895 [Capronia epimyces CBS 606.96]EXJ77666.1 hypothetical protein A1O3_09895 [Capronia epimyces CBS 606.96]